MATAPQLSPERFPVSATAEFAADVTLGLSHPGQKELPSKYLYDEVGSALFDVICLLPEYGLSRAGMRLLQKHSGEIVARLPRPVTLAELGSGSGLKTRWLLEALARRQRVHYFPIDISRSALHRCQKELGHMDNVSVVGFENAYLEGLREVAALRREDPLLVLFLGSTIGNFDRPAGDQFLREVRSVLRPGDSLLLATDLVKPVPRLLLAYDDSAGVTAAFNKNLLARINRELGGNFDPAQFDHLARWDAGERRIEMHLRSRTWQRVNIRAAARQFLLQPGETIWTESSHKYDPVEVKEMGASAGFRSDMQWIDSEWELAHTLFFAA